MEEQNAPLRAQRQVGSGAYRNPLQEHSCSIRMQTELLLVTLCYLYVVSAAGETQTAFVKNKAKIKCKHGLQTVDIITWKKDGVQIAYKSKTEINIEQRYALDKGAGVSFLIIKEAREEDAGTYTCNAYISEQRHYESIDIKLKVKATGNIVECSLIAILFGFLVHKIFV
ncbi:hypothetical protein SKAU_G00404680 [Synaphobranchus kaupii]|uniref:Ig-like domain-containing protein n=1 Tax=Synaphobranchus kaupii TaxID=118154 RepID=A0A9Q1ICP4_SYNKA|nr:hypothetical protein SKAU_G00404680 [Synaphobranchus kaupii]